MKKSARLVIAAACVVAIAGGVTGGTPAARTRAGGCLDRFGVTDALGTGRARGAADRVLNEARGFSGDRYVGRLRWATAHAMLESAEAANARVGRIRDGVVPVTGATRIRAYDPDYGNPLLAGWVLGGLRASDGRPLWGRAGEGATADSVDPAGESVAEDWRAGTGSTASFDLATGMARWCRTRVASIFLDDGTGVTMNRGSLAKITLPEGREIWRAGREYMQTKKAADTLIAATGIGAFDSYPVGTVSELAAFRLSDGQRRWRVTERAPGPGPKADGLPIRKLLGSADGVVLVAEQRFTVPNSTRLAAYDLRDGRLRWARPARPEKAEGRIDLNIKIAGSRVLLTEPGGRIRAIKVSDGSTEWSATVAEVPNLTAGAVHGRHLYTVVSRPDDARTDDAHLVTIDLTDGTVTPVRGLPSLREPNDIAIGAGLLVVQFRNLTLAFDLP